MALPDEESDALFGVDPELYLEEAAKQGDSPPEIEGAGAPHFTEGMLADLIVE